MEFPDSRIEILSLHYHIKVLMPYSHVGVFRNAGMGGVYQHPQNTCQQIYLLNTTQQICVTWQHTHTHTVHPPPRTPTSKKLVPQKFGAKNWCDTAAHTHTHTHTHTCTMSMYMYVYACMYTYMYMYILLHVSTYVQCNSWSPTIGK